MNCLEFRRQVLTDPRDLDADARAHRDSCATCQRFDNEIRELNTRIHQALKVELPEALPEKILLNQSLRRRRQRRRWFGLAASLLVALSAVTWFVQPDSGLGESVVAHIELEQSFIDPRKAPVAAEAVQQVLSRVDADIEQPVKDIVFADNCIMNGKLVAHFVVEDANREYTVLLIPHAELNGTISIDHRQWRGLVQPHGTDGLAVVTAGTGRTDRDALERVANRYASRLIRAGA